MVNSRVVILGARGMLGSDLCLQCRRENIEYMALDLPEFDITSYSRLLESVKDADIIINCAAYTNVEKAESEADVAYKVNAEAVGRLGEIARRTRAWVLHISTDFVFDGTSQKPYSETDLPNPISAYGKTKLAGEHLLAESGCGYCILRVEWTYGLCGTNFIAKLVSEAKKRPSLKVVEDQVGSPTATTEIAATICKLIEKQPSGILHFASAGYVSRYELARFIFSQLSINTALEPCKTADFPTAAKRPLNSRFDCSKISSMLQEEIQPWEVPLKEFLRKL